MTLDTRFTLLRLPVGRLRQESSEWWARVWGVVLFAGEKPPEMPDEVPLSVTHTPLLGSTEETCEVWLAPAPLLSGQDGNLVYRHDGQLLFGTIAALESSEYPGKPSLHQTTARAYQQVFACLDELAYPWLTRVWNYFPAIFQVQDESERYWQFNSGRQDAFRARHRATTGAVPAACALGNRGQALSLSFLAAVAPPLAFENPRQTRAYHYPPQYGPRSPTFSRAMGLPDGALFISGTASIVGHHTRHPDDVRAQTRETLSNIQALLEEIRQPRPDDAIGLGDLCYRVYIRNPADLEPVRKEFHKAVGRLDRVLFLQAEVCRRDLLVEIEASALHGQECSA